MQCWDVFLNERLIDSVFFTLDCDLDYVRSSLIDHDGYHPAIYVTKGHAA